MGPIPRSGGDHATRRKGTTFAGRTAPAWPANRLASQSSATGPPTTAPLRWSKPPRVMCRLASTPAPPPPVLQQLLGLLERDDLIVTSMVQQHRHRRRDRPEAVLTQARTPVRQLE